MNLIPAIDIHGAKAVRLEQGDFARETVYAEDPLEAARSWVGAGARTLHVVDLDGAREGQPVNLDQLERISGAVDATVQYGGGLRSHANVRDALAAGADRVVLGTAVYSDVDLLEDVIAAWDTRVVVAVDVKQGHVSVSGWQRTTQMRAEDVIRRMQQRGVRQFLYTNVDRDGMLAGPDVAELSRVAATIRGRFIYSGGIGSLADLEALNELRLVNLAGVIAGKALYEGRFSLAEGQAVLEAR